MKQKRTWFNPPEVIGEINNLPSETVPDQTLSVKEIMVRYARGLPLEGQRVPIWNGEDDDMPDPRTLDLSERQDFAEQAKEELKQLKNKKQKSDEKTPSSSPSNPSPTTDVP